MSDRTEDVIFYALTLLLPLSALVARRLPVRDTVKMALAWVAIFVLLFGVVAAWQQAMGVGSGLRDTLGL